MSVSFRDPHEHSILGAMRHQIETTQMPSPPRLPRVRAPRLARHPRILAGGATAAVAAQNVSGGKKRAMVLRQVFIGLHFG